jgi:hypothetical protein
MTTVSSNIAALATLLQKFNDAGGDPMGVENRHNMTAINRHLEELLPGFVLAPKAATEFMWLHGGNVAPSLNDEPTLGRIGDRAAAEAYRAMLARRPHRPDQIDHFPLPKRWANADPNEWPKAPTPEDWWQQHRNPKRSKKGGAA